MAYTIREANLWDIDRVYELFSEVDSMHLDALPHVFQMPPDSTPIKEYYRTALADKNARIYVCETTECLVAAILAFLREPSDVPLFIPQPTITISNLIVEEPHRQAGIGRDLVMQVHKWALELNVQQIELTVWHFNQNAKDFYTYLGYEPLHQRMAIRLT